MKAHTCVWAYSLSVPLGVLAAAAAGAKSEALVPGVLVGPMPMTLPASMTAAALRRHLLRGELGVVAWGAVAWGEARRGGARFRGSRCTWLASGSGALGDGP